MRRKHWAWKGQELQPEDILFLLGLMASVICPLFYKVYQKILVPALPWEGCVALRLLGIYCPGCGGTRAVDAFWAGRIWESVRLHPLVPYSIVLYLIFMGSQLLFYLSKGRVRRIGFHSWFLYGALVIMIVNWLLKNVLLFMGIPL